MKKRIIEFKIKLNMTSIILFSFLLIKTSFGQNIVQAYFDLCKRADSLYEAKDFKNSAYTYSSAFKANGWKGTVTDCYNAACAWALVNMPDSAFFYLKKVVFSGGYTNYRHISTDADLAILHKEDRWKILLEKVKANKDKAEANLDKPLANKLDSILNEDQASRLQIDEYVKKYGWASKETQGLWKAIRIKDSSNLRVITDILDKYGWLGPDVVGSEGNSALFLVIQHSNQKTQEKYLPIMREAVKSGKAKGSSLALLEDRVALARGKKQIYGSQIGRNEKDNTYYVLPLEDPDNVDKRRKEVGLAPLAEYIKHWNIKLDLNEDKLNEFFNSIDTCRIVHLSIQNDTLLSWVIKDLSVNDSIIVENFIWNGWRKICSVEFLGSTGEQSFSVLIKPSSGENQIRISFLFNTNVSKVIKWRSNFPEVECVFQRDTKTVRFSENTFFELYDINGKIVQKGFGKVLNVKKFRKGTYTLFYDNSIIKIDL